MLATIFAPPAWPGFTVVMTVVDRAGSSFESRPYYLTARNEDAAIAAAWDRAESDYGAGYFVAYPASVNGVAVDPEVNWQRVRMSADDAAAA
jgi:hypothetical protein